MALDAAQMGVCEIDLRTGKAVRNVRYDQLFGYEWLQPSWGIEIALAHVVPEDRESLRKSLDDALVTGTWKMEFKVIWPDGALHWIAAHGHVDSDVHGQPLRLVGVALDVSEPKRVAMALTEAREVAESANRAKSAFLANMSHEIRTPMNGVIGMAELMLAHPLTPDQRQRAETITSSADSLLSVLNDILDFSKIEAGMLHFETVDFDLQTLLEGVVQLLASAARQKGIELLIDLDSDVPRSLRGDPMRLRQILVNLAGNAVKFTAKGKVVVRAVLQDDSNGKVALRISVTESEFPRMSSTDSSSHSPRRTHRPLESMAGAVSGSRSPNRS
jgi:two-component system sensor histidine kinase/response regulator